MIGKKEVSIHKGKLKRIGNSIIYIDSRDECHIFVRHALNIKLLGATSKHPKWNGCVFTLDVTTGIISASNLKDYNDMITIQLHDWRRDRGSRNKTSKLDSECDWKLAISTIYSNDAPVTTIILSKVFIPNKNVWNRNNIKLSHVVIHKSECLWTDSFTYQSDFNVYFHEDFIWIERGFGKSEELQILVPCFGKFSIPVDHPVKSRKYMSLTRLNVPLKRRVNITNNIAHNIVRFNPNGQRSDDDHTLITYKTLKECASDFKTFWDFYKLLDRCNPHGYKIIISELSRALLPVGFQIYVKKNFIRKLIV